MAEVNGDSTVPQTNGHTTAYESFVGDRRTLRRAMEFLDDVNEEIEALVREHWVVEGRDAGGLS